MRMLWKNKFKVSGPLRFFFFNSFIPVISVELGETTLTILFATCEPISMESETVRLVSLSAREISEITRLKIRSLGSGCLNASL